MRLATVGNAIQMQVKIQLAGSARRPPWQIGARGFFAFLCLAVFAWQPAAAAARRSIRIAPRTGVPGASFVIADFDGDSLPDFATVRAGPAMALRTNYWI